MAQALAPSLVRGAASLAPPPGLVQPDLAMRNGGAQIADTANEVKEATLQSVQDKLNQMGANVNHQAVIEAIREVVRHDVDLKVAEKIDEWWQKGSKMMSQIQQKHKEKTNKLTEDVTECHEKLRGLEKENENLKQMVQTLHTRFAVLGAVFSGKETPAIDTPDATVAGESTMASASLPMQETASSDETAEMEGAGKATKLPDVPAFPFPAQPSSPPAPLSLAEALGTQTPQRTPMSFVNPLTPLTASPEVARTPVNGAGLFSFTLRKADGADLGLNVSHHEQDRLLRVEGVRPDGAVEAWNRQCAGSASFDKVVVAGDKIISVNSIAYDPEKMLEECRDKQLLKLTVVRGDRVLPTMAAKASPPNKTTTLRADASVFVPMNTDTTAPPQEEDGATEQAGSKTKDEETPDGSATLQQAETSS